MAVDTCIQHVGAVPSRPEPASNEPFRDRTEGAVLAVVRGQREAPVVVDTAASVALDTGSAVLGCHVVMPIPWCFDSFWTVDAADSGGLRLLADCVAASAAPRCLPWSVTYVASAPVESLRRLAVERSVHTVVVTGGLRDVAPRGFQRLFADGLLRGVLSSPRSWAVGLITDDGAIVPDL